MDVFAGGGGLSLGLTRAGFRLRLAVENDRHAADTLYLNHPEAPKGVVDARDVRKILDDPALGALKGVDVVAGGPPCQPFSMARRHSKADRLDPRRFLFRAFLEIVEVLRPRMVIMENVPGIRNASGGDIAEEIEHEFSRVGYAMKHRTLNAADLGVPQNRRRVFFIGAARDHFEDPEAAVDEVFADIQRKPAVSVTAKEALSGIPRVDPGAGGLVVPKTSRGKRSAYAQELTGQTPFLYNHQARAHNDRDLEIFRELRRGETAGSLEQRRPNMIPYQLKSFSDKFRRIHPQKPAPTIPAHLCRDANSFVHPDVPRGITGREAARFQSFPDDYVFLGGFGPTFIQIGNAVPPKMGEAVGRSVLKILRNASR